MAITDNSPVKFYFTTSSAYHFIEPKEDGAIYYLTDTNELRIGDNALTISSLKSLQILDDPKKETDAVNKKYVDSRKINIDAELNSESENPVQNKVINSALNNKVNSYGGSLSAALLQNGTASIGNLVLYQKNAFTDPDTGRTYNGTYFNKDARIRNLVDPVLDGDAVSKSWVTGLVVNYTISGDTVTRDVPLSDIINAVNNNKPIKAIVTEEDGYTKHILRLAHYNASSYFVFSETYYDGSQLIYREINDMISYNPRLTEKVITIS